MTWYRMNSWRVSRQCDPYMFLQFLFCWENDLLQSKHSNVFSPEWTLLCIVSLFDVLRVLVSHQHELSYAPSIRATLRMTCYIVDTSMVSLQHEAFYGWPVCWMLRRIWYILDSCRVSLLYELSNENSAWLRLWTIWYILNSYTILSLSELCFVVPWYSLMKQRTFLDSQFCLSSWKIFGIIASRRN